MLERQNAAPIFRTLNLSACSIARAAQSRGARGGQSAEHQEAHSGTHALVAQRQLHVSSSAALWTRGSGAASSTGREAPAHTEHPRGTIR